MSSDFSSSVDVFAGSVACFSSLAFSTLRLFLGGTPEFGFAGDLDASPETWAFSACLRFCLTISLCFSRLALMAASFAFCRQNCSWS